jgi:polar amino acid transport system permease protein
MGSYVAAVAWYLIICSILMVGQSYLETRFGRGFGTGQGGAGGRARFLAFRGGAGGA